MPPLSSNQGEEGATCILKARVLANYVLSKPSMQGLDIALKLEVVHMHSVCHQAAGRLLVWLHPRASQVICTA